MKIYGISGLGADKRVFQFLNFESQFIPIEWIKPLKKESIEQYALRLSKNIISKNQKFGIVGVSFGGLIATEISKKLNPVFTILISSVETKNDLRLSYRLIGKTNIAQIIPQRFFSPPKFLISFLFGAKNIELLNQIIEDTDIQFTKWAINQLLTWENSEHLKNCLKICGSKDVLIPPSKTGHIHIIKGGKHFMIVDNAKEINQVVNQFIKNLQ